MSNAMTTTPNASPLMPSNLRDAMDLAGMMSKGKLVPMALQGNPSDCLMVIEQSMRWGMSPFAVAQEVNVIQGRMMYSGKIVAAAIHTSGVLDGRLSYQFTGTNGDLAVIVTARLRGEAEPRSVTVRLQDAKTKNDHWAKSPEQMLTYHGARVWARRHAPEVMLGVYAPEEFEPDERPEPRPVQSTVIRPAPKPSPLAEALNDAIPDWDAPPPPKPDRLRKVADRIKERLAEATDQASYNAVMEHEGVKAEWDKIRSERPELAAELEAWRGEQLDRIAAAYDATEAAA